jgi:multiple sugar transport system permease protein
VSQNALWAVVIADAWMWTPFVILLATAAFRGIPTGHQRGGGPRRRLAAFPLHADHAADVDADPAHRLPTAADRRLQAERFAPGDDRRRPGLGDRNHLLPPGKIAFSYFFTGQASALAVILLIIITGLSMNFVRLLVRQARQE